MEKEWKKNAVVHNLPSVQNVIEPYVNAALKMLIAAFTAIISVMIYFKALLVLAISIFRNCRSEEQLNAAISK